MLNTAKVLALLSCFMFALCMDVAALPAPVAGDCPRLPEPRSRPGDTSFNNTVRSQMWINDGVWWGAFSDGSTGIYFYKLVKDNLIKMDLINDNFDARPDVIWNGSDLFILMHDSSPPDTPSLARLYKYSYVRRTKTYSLRQKFPIDLPLAGDVFDIAFDQDSTGKLWATYTDTVEGRVHVIWSTSKNHRQWDTKGKILGSGLAVDTEEAATIVRFNAIQQHRPAVGVVWSNQAAGKISFRFHLDRKAEEDWSAEETVDCCESTPESSGVADDHLSLRATPDGRLFLVAKDDLGEEGRLHLYVRNIKGAWGQKTIVDPDPKAAPTRPILTLDLRNQVAYVIYRDSSEAGGGRLFFVRTSVRGKEKAPEFTEPCLFIDLSVNSPTSTKRGLTRTHRLVAVASGDDQMFWTSIPLGSLSKPFSALDLFSELKPSSELEPFSESELFEQPELSPAPADEVEIPQAQTHPPQTLSSRMPAGVPPAQYGSIWEGKLSFSQTPAEVAQWRWLRNQRVKAVVIFDPSRDYLGKHSFEGFLWLPLNRDEPPTDAEAGRFLKYVQRSEHHKVHMSKAEGNGVIALMLALIHYAIEGQSVEAALAEARQLTGGAELSSAQEEWLRSWATKHKPASHRRR